MKKAEGQTKKKGMYLVATFGTVTLVALGALAVGLMNPKDGKNPPPIDLNATPTPGAQSGPGQNVAKTVTPVPTAAPITNVSEMEPQGGVKQTTEVPDTSIQTAEVAEPEDAAVMNPDGVIKGLNFSAETGMLWPVEGEALIPFSPDHAIYHKTLDSYRASNYVYLAAEEGTPVTMAADGIVSSVKEDLKTGTTVTVQVSENHEIVYGMLSKVAVKEGDFVDAGTVFAKVAEPSRYFAEDGCGLYVQVLEQDEPVNPMIYLQ